MAEKRGARDAIDEMTRRILDTDPTVRGDRARARKIAQDAARRVNHGEPIHTEGKKPRN